METEANQTGEAQQIFAELTYTPFVNSAMHQNGLPAVREILLTNHTGRDLEHVECVFSSPADLISEKTVVIDCLKNGEELPVHDLGIELNYQLLSSISEAVKGKICFDVRHQGQVKFHRELDITAFAADQWLGTQFMPELLCAFVTPNLDVINHLLTVAAEELKSATGSASLNGYQEDRRRVYEICSAIYRAIHSWGIHYANPASSFGVPGQRIRFADSICQFRLGTCLDTTLLFASVMEQCGLHPVILLQEGHAYIGCHLVDRYFPDLPMDDLQTIRKLVDLDEFLVIETTMVTGDSTFSEAEAAARTNHLNIDDDFQCAIDVVRARFSGIHPLPLKRSTNGIEFESPESKAEELGEEQKRKLQEEVDLSKLKNTEQRAARIARWTQKLLDLSLRNRLLNVRDTKFVIPIVCPDITILEDKLAANEAISLHPLENLLGEKDLHDIAMLRNSEIKSDIKLLLEKELQQKRLWTMLKPGEMERRLTTLYRQGRTDLEEGGVNTLFVGVGFLEWKASPRDEKTYLAPILLVPVRLQRKASVDGLKITMSRIDEDTVINETLLELLRSQFHCTVPGLSPLPTDQSGVDVGLVMQIFRQTVKDIPGWEVREEAKLGLFSFGKFIMWTDLTARADKLKQNLLVKHLIEGGGMFDDNVEVFPPEEIGQHLDLKNLYCPMSADSSQLTAVLYSALGKNFVLHGPPGTGKSQTITNIIAHNLAMGKRVLFVSEKKAALEVVHKRLSSIGLRPFCLELHSSKSGKTEVLAQFAEALAVPEMQEPEQWLQTAEEMQKLRDDLNGYVTALHKKYPNGKSAYDCFSRLLCSQPHNGILSVPSILEQTKEEYESIRQLVSDLANGFELTGPDVLAALACLDSHEWSPVFERELLHSVKEFLAAIEAWKKCSTDFCKLIHLPEQTSISVISKMTVLAEKLQTAPDIPSSLLNSQFRENSQFLLSFIQISVTLAGLQKKLNNYNLEMVRSLDVDGIRARIQQNAQSFFLLKLFKNNALLKELSGLKKIGGIKLTVSELSQCLPDFTMWNETIQQYESMREKAKSLLGNLWQDYNKADWGSLTRILESGNGIFECVESITGKNTDEFTQCCMQLYQLLPEAGTQFKDKFTGFPETEKHFQELRQVFTTYSGKISCDDDLDELYSCLNRIVKYSEYLRSGMRCLNIKEKMSQCGLAEFVSALEKGTFGSKEADSVFESAYAGEMLDQILVENHILAQFNGLDHNQRIRKFCELDDRYTGLARRAVFAKLAASLPRRRSGPCPEGTELGLLKRECEKKARQKPVRQLLAEIPNLAPVLKPCFLMSPLSVAQYLPADSASFDLIVFDEASQIPVWDAIGVIARGKQLIVVGDPKQMPPTNFFQKGNSADNNDDPDDLEDMESILDECLAAGVHSSYLNWHYRSRHESLISFSNHYYYGDRLYTFPAACLSDKLGVKFRFVADGVYDKSGTRTNRKEAQALVDYILTQLKNSEGKKRSFGVVTFSEAQKNLIEDMLERERTKYPELEPYFSDQNEDAPFVKNLENVQGDERDVILFSICYAPDADGKFSMNFGPLNRQGGERRLNVAITRAKEQVVVFSSIHAHQIDIARTNAVGAAHLKYFLDYAEKGLHIQASGTDHADKNNLAAVIENVLKEHGFSTERNAGSSGYKIDIAVRNPENTGEFLMGIECDGPAYASQRTIRDRDHLRHDVLRALGWHIRQEWTVDWAFDRKQSESALLAGIEKAKTNEDAVPQPPPPPQPAVPVIPEEPQIKAVPVKEKKTAPFYEPAAVVCGMPQEAFYDADNYSLIREQMMQVIDSEAPVYESVIKKRIMKSWGLSRTTERISSVMRICYPRDVTVTETADDRVYWRKDQNPAEYREYRVNRPNSTGKRTIDEIPPEEIANAMFEILTDFNTCEEDILFRETIRLLGFSSVTAKAKKYLDAGLRLLQQNKSVGID